MATVLGHINIVVNDLDAARDFFVTYFGFEAGAATPLHGEWADRLNHLPHVRAIYIPLTQAGSTTRIELLKFLEPASCDPRDLGRPNELGYRHIGFQVDDIDATVAELEAAGVPFLSPVQYVQAMNLKTVYFLGPEGILMQLTQSL
jgi:catechol 2,3-dioxygenase-like lactoylglutathione lyase family enzyme